MPVGGIRGLNLSEDVRRYGKILSVWIFNEWFCLEAREFYK